MTELANEFKTSEAIAALKRLLKIAHSDTGQSKIVADFLLAWWNARRCGGFDLTDIWGVDRRIADDMVSVFKLIALSNEYPIAFGFRKEFENLVLGWRSMPTDKASV